MFVDKINFFGRVLQKETNANLVKLIYVLSVLFQLPCLELMLLVLIFFLEFVNY